MSLFNSLIKSLLNEGGQAAENLIANLVATTGNGKLKYTRATPTPEVLDEVQNLLTLLRSHGFIDAKQPSYCLGSSRLFAIKAGLKAPEPNEIETQEIIDKALQTKKDFGDIDLDVHLVPGITTKQIQTFLNTDYGKKYAASIAGEEVNIAVIVGNSNNVIQIDVVDINDENEAYMNFSQFSSMADMSVNVKGMVRDVLIRSIAATVPINPEITKEIDDKIKSSGEYLTFAKKYGSQGNIGYDIRYSLAGPGLSYKISWLVNDVEKAFSKGGIKFDQLQKFLNGESIQPVPYAEMEKIANILGFKNPADMKHVVKMAELIKTFDLERKQIIWDKMIKILESKIPNPERGRTQGQISEEDALAALEYLKPFFDGVDFSSANTFFGESFISEAVKMTSIPHLDQMTPADFCNLFAGGGWEVSEKYDGSNVSFGLNDENKIYVKSKKGNPTTEESDFYAAAKHFNNDIFEGFARLLSALKKSDISSLLSGISESLGSPVQIFGEMFSKAHMNVIPYAEDLIGTGSVIIFGIVKLDTPKGTDITNTEEGYAIKEQIISELNGVDGWNFYNKKPLELDIEDGIKNQIVKVCRAETLAALATRKRTGAEAELKAKTAEEFRILQSMIKQTLLKSVESVPSSLGASEIEGAIIRNIKTGAIAKLVDLEGFGKRRAEQWAGVDALKDHRKALFSQLKDDVLKNADIFVLNDKQIQKLTDAMETQGAKFSSLDQMLDVLYGDASAEVQFKEASQMVADLTASLAEYKKDIKTVLGQINKDDTKSLQDTQNAITTETESVDKFIQELNKRILNNQNPYLSVIQFVLGPKTLEELKAKFLASAQ